MLENPLPIILVPGLLCSARLYARQIPELWRCGAVIIADHTRDPSMAEIAQRILHNAPPRFTLIGLSMGGYIALEIMRQARERVARIALLDTSARSDTPEQSELRRAIIALARRGQLEQIADQLFPKLVHRSRHDDEAMQQIVRLMAAETGTEAFIRQEEAIISRADSRSLLSSIKCPALVMVGDADELTPPELAEEIAGGIPGACLIKVPDCGHLSTLEQPRTVTETLVRWMQPDGV